MQQKLFFISLIFVFFSLGANEIEIDETFRAALMADVEWTIVGAGPAGIVSVGLLIDAGIDPNKIMWIDDAFEVGRIGKYYQNVPGNLPTKVLINFIHACKTFAQCPSAAIQRLYTYKPDKEYPLYVIVEPLQDITYHLLGRVKSIKGRLTALEFIDDDWYLNVGAKYVKSRKVILASGSKPKVLDYDCEPTIPFDIALDKENLSHHVKVDDTIAVVGSAHSAVLILKYLYELGILRVINFYKKPIVYAVNQGTWFLNNSAGLRGDTARWAQEVLEKLEPASIFRVKNTAESLKCWLPVCDKIIYACGFEPNPLPTVEGVNVNYGNYDKTTGAIGPRLFGVGIAFPEHFTDPTGAKQFGIGFHHFMRYIKENLPGWLAKDYEMSEFNELFIINVL